MRDSSPRTRTRRAARRWRGRGAPCCRRDGRQAREPSTPKSFKALTVGKVQRLDLPERCFSISSLTEIGSPQSLDRRSIICFILGILLFWEIIKDITVSYNISDQGVLTARADVSVNVTAADSCGFNALTSLTVDDSAKKQRDGDYAVKLYFGVDNEDIWDIAKRFSTEVEAVMEENDLSDTTLDSGRMLLIPIKE